MNSSKKLFLSFFAGALLITITSWVLFDDTSSSDPNPEPIPVAKLEDAIAKSMEDMPDDQGKNEVLISLIYEGLSQVHYQPLKMDDEFSSKAFALYTERIDFNKRFLTSSDFAELSAYQDKIDDQVLDAKFELFDLAYDIQVKREAQVKQWYEEFLAQPFNFDKDEEVIYDGDKVDYATSESELKERWRKILKYETLTRLVDQMEIQEKALANGDEDFEEKDFATLEEDAREKVLKTYNDWFERLSKFDRDDRRATYINAIANVYGPHTEYFPPVDKENFDISMSGKLEGIGARLIEKEGYIRVSEIVPGSASALQGELEAEDIIMEVTQEAETEATSIVGAKIDDAVKLIRGPKGTVVTLTVKKLDGEIRDISITRDVVIIEETYAKSAIMEMDGKKYGVLDLPKFYADFSGSGGRSSAADVKAELEKLTAEKVDGVILDLRGNGGGSLADAVTMAGLFIELGPVVQVKSNTGAPRVLSDTDPQIQYDGDLVILVDHFSASASEILAAAMQDYKRGVVVGSKSSFGKGTVQQFIELDRFVTPAFDHVKPLGALKITLQKFYRISGGATQLKGVTPDIILPDTYSEMEVGERDQDHVMPWDKIDPAKYEEWGNRIKPDKLAAKSDARVKKSEVFSLISENAQRLKRQRDRSVFPLKLEAYRAAKKEWDDEAKKYKDMRKEIEGLEIRSLEADKSDIESDEKKKDRVEAWHKSLGKDPYLEEAIHILQDL